LLGDDYFELLSDELFDLDLNAETFIPVGSYLTLL
jgi:hypothetical protein